MSSQMSRFSLLAVALLALSGCSVVGDADNPLSTSGGMIELAVSETCTESSDPQCVSVNDENVVLPSAFEQADVKNAVVSSRTAIDVTFTDVGAALFQSLTEKVARAGGTARLVMRIGNEIRSAVAVPEALDSDYLQIILSPHENAQEVVDLINRK